MSSSPMAFSPHFSTAACRIPSKALGHGAGVSGLTIQFDILLILKPDIAEEPIMPLG